VLTGALIGANINHAIPNAIPAAMAVENAAKPKILVRRIAAITRPQLI
jgi:hypothetical protein